MKEHYALDFEATGLHRDLSFPIEVGYTNGTFSRDMLIKVPPPFDQFWSWESELIHHISQKDLREYGKDPYDVCVIMNNDLAGEELAVDGGYYDQLWCERLFVECDMKMKFKLLHPSVRQMDEWFTYKKTVPTAHRALDDAKQLWEFMDGC